MRPGLIKKVDFLNLSPYVRYVQELNRDDIRKVPPRIIYDTEIIFWMKGSAEYKIEDKEYTIKPGDIQIIPPHTVHSYSMPKGNLHYYAVHFDLIYMGESLDFSADDVYTKIDYQNIDSVPLEEDLAGRPIVMLGEIELPNVIHTSEPYSYTPLFQEMMSVFLAKPYGYHLEMRGLLLRILYKIVNDISTQEGVRSGHPHKKEVIQAIHYMHNHYNEDLDLNALAKSLSISPNYFRTLFKEATGKTFVEFLIQIRLEKAKDFLIQGDYNVSEVSRMVGYDDIHYFSKLFKKIEGLSPKNYIESSLALLK